MKTYSKPSRKYAKRRRHFKQYREQRLPQHNPPQSGSQSNQHLSAKGE